MKTIKDSTAVRQGQGQEWEATMGRSLPKTGCGLEKG